MSGMSTYLIQKIIGHVHQGLAYPVPAGTWLALFTADPTDDNVTANELAAAWYAREQVNSWSAPIGAGQTTSNSNLVTYDAVTGAAVSVTHWALYDAVSGGNLLHSGPLPATKVLDINDICQLQPGDIVLNYGLPA